MKYLFMLLFSLAIVTGVTAFNGEYEKSPPGVPTVVVFTYQIFEAIAPATADINITTEARSHLIFEAVIPYNELAIVAVETQRVRWQHLPLNITSTKITQPARVKPTLQKNRSCLELNC